MASLVWPKFDHDGVITGVPCNFWDSCPENPAMPTYTVSLTVLGREQQLVEYYLEMGLSANKINGISSTKGNLSWHLEASLSEFGPLP